MMSRFTSVLVTFIAGFPKATFVSEGLAGKAVFVCRRVANVFVIVFAVMALSACASLLKPTLEQSLVDIKPGDYSLDKKHATILFKVDHMGFSKFVGRFNVFDASLVWNPEAPETSSLEAIVDMRSVDINNEKFERALKGKFWFNSEVYPQAVFKTISATLVDAQHLKFMGELTFLGVTAPIELDVKVRGAATNLLTTKYTLGFSASTVFSRSIFGLDNYIPAVGDDIELEIHAEFQRQ